MNSVDFDSLRVGDTVLVATDFGIGPTVKAVITSVEDDIKNGRPGIDYYKVSNPDDSRWAYADQIIKKLNA